MTTKYVSAVSLQMMLASMQKYSTGGPGQTEILTDMKRLTDSVGALAVLAGDSNPELAPEQRQARTIKAASKLGSVLPTVKERLDALVATTTTGFDRAFAEHSGLTTTERAAEIRNHLKGLKDPAERSVFVQELVKNNDNESLGAVVFAPAYLSGLDATTHTRLRGQIEETRLPELTANREAFSELSGNLQVALTVAEGAVRDCSNPSKLADMERQAAAAKGAEDSLAASTAGPGGA